MFREVRAVDDPRLEPLCAAMEELNETKALAAARELADDDVSAFAVFEALGKGMRRVDKRYEAGEYFIADLIMAAHIMRSVMDRAAIRPEESRGPSMGRVLICTVQGDIHDLGKSMIGEVLRHNGFELIDLGVDAAPDTVVQAIRSHKPQILILSGTLQSSARSIRGTIRTVEASGLRNRVRILVGGSAVKGLTPRLLGADARSDSILDCLRICHEFMAQAAGDRP